MSHGGDLTETDLYLFNEGSHFRLYEKLGAHPGTRDGTEGVDFRVWAPAAERVSVVGGFNGWRPGANPMRPVGNSGVWTTFVAGIGPGERYKYHVESMFRGYRSDRSDPFAFHTEPPPATASVVWDLGYDWGDSAWMEARKHRNALEEPVSIYEVHLGSWQRDGSRFLNYRDIAPRLAEYVSWLGYTHVEFLPVMEHPFFGSWGYQVTGYYAPTSRQGTPQDFMYLVDYLHRHGIGVILDWVPSHFPSDGHGLAFFDGTHQYEHADPRKGFHPDWRSYIYNYDRGGVRSFLISNAVFWLDRYHVDGLRVDAVASMLYLDYSRKDGEWEPNMFGGRDNLGAVSFLRRFNEVVYEQFPGVQTIAEESTAWAMVSRPTSVGGLGFGMKWDMGWMHDTLRYMSHDPVHRSHHHDDLTFRMLYAWTENYVLALSHDEVVHGKGSLLRKMPGDDWQRFANLRLLYGYMYAQPGKKLLFMGGEFGQWDEWYHESELDWRLLDEPAHRAVAKWLGDLNRLYREEPAMHRRDTSPSGFEWIDCQDRASSVLALLRRGEPGDGLVVAVGNFTPVPRHDYRLGVPESGAWREVLNSDSEEYGGSGQGNLGEVMAEPIPHQGRNHSIRVTLPPLAIVFLKWEPPA